MQSFKIKANTVGRNAMIKKEVVHFAVRKAYAVEKVGREMNVTEQSVDPMVIIALQNQVKSTSFV